MKALILSLTLLSSLSAMAYETRNETSYSGPGYGNAFGETALSGTSRVALREQVNMNESAVATFLQSDSINASSADIKEIANLAKAALHESIDKMSDREAIESSLSLK